jgi:hypothetical protein
MFRYKNQTTAIKQTASAKEAPVTKHAPAIEQSSATKESANDSLVYRLAYRLGMQQTKKISRIAFFKRTAITALCFFALGTVLFVWLPRAAYVGTAELAVIIVAILVVFGRVLFSLILGYMGFEKAKNRLNHKK